MRMLYLKDIHEHLQGANMALVGVHGFTLRRGKDGAIEVDSSGALLGIQEYRQAGVRVTYAVVKLQHLLRQLARWLAPEEAKKIVGDRITGEPLNLPAVYYEELTKIVGVMDRVLRKAGMERTIYHIWDEPSGDNERRLVIRTAKTIRKVVKDPLMYCNVNRTVYYGYDKPELALAPHCNVWWVYHEITDQEREREAKRGTMLLKNFGNRNLPKRARPDSGFLMWRRSQGGANMWAYDVWRASTSTQLDGPFFGDAGAVYPTMPITPRLAWEATRQGLYDLRYLVTLEDMIARAKRAGGARTKGTRPLKAAAAAQEWLDAVWKAMDAKKLYTHYKDGGPLWEDTSEYQKHRRQIADHILRLIEAGVAPGQMRTDAADTNL